jgi:hypothetical protein
VLGAAGRVGRLGPERPLGVGDATAQPVALELAQGRAPACERALVHGATAEGGLQVGRAIALGDAGTLLGSPVEPCELLGVRTLRTPIGTGGFEPPTPATQRQNAPVPWGSAPSRRAPRSRWVSGFSASIGPEARNAAGPALRQKVRQILRQMRPA